MVAQLTTESISIAVRGENGRSGGLVACSFAARPNSYDHKRHHHWRTKGWQGEQKFPIWDFILHRDDNTAIRLHPQWSTVKVETFEFDGHDEPVEPPPKGLGKSKGPGTYKWYKDAGNALTLKFDPTKKKQN